MEPVIKIGKTIKSFGKEGHIRIVIDSPFKSDVENSRYLLIEKEGYSIPYFIEEIDIEAGLVKFDEIHGPEDTKSLSDSDIYLLERDVSTTIEPKVNTVAISGFLLVDQDDNEVGSIIRILELPMQEILIVEIQEKEIMVPFHEDLLLNFDMDRKVLQLAIPEGLIDL